MATPTGAADVDVFAEKEQEFVIGYGEIIAKVDIGHYSEEALRVGTDRPPPPPPSLPSLARCSVGSGRHANIPL